jgi:hypothetical protein
MMLVSHAGALLPAALASVPFRFVLVRVRCPCYFLRKRGGCCIQRLRLLFGFQARWQVDMQVGLRGPGSQGASKASKETQHNQRNSYGGKGKL